MQTSKTYWMSIYTGIESMHEQIQAEDKNRAHMKHQCSLNTSTFTCVGYVSLSLIFYTPRVRVSTIYFY